MGSARWPAFILIPALLAVTFAGPAHTTRAQSQIDPALRPALDALFGVDQVGPSYAEWVPGLGVNLVVGDLPPGVNGAYAPAGNTVTVGRAVASEDPRAVAAVLAHEIMHAVQTAAGEGGNRDCVRMEVKAYLMQSVVWLSFWNGLGPGRTPLERSLNDVADVLVSQGEPGLYAAVAGFPGYQDECSLWVPPGAQPSPAATPAPRAISGPELDAQCARLATDMTAYFAAIGGRTPGPLYAGYIKACQDLAAKRGQQGVNCFAAGNWAALSELAARRDPKAVAQRLDAAMAACARG